MASKFFWYELMTDDRAAAEAFYKEVIGWTLSPYGPAEDPYVIVEAGGRGVGGIMAIPKEACDQGMKPCWAGYVHVGDIDAAVAKVRAGGGKVYREPQMIPNIGRFAVCADPQGAMFNLMQPEGEDMPPVPMGTVGAIDWHELHSSDGKAGFGFYAGQFGWSATDALDMGPMGTYQMFAMEPVSGPTECGVTVGGMMTDAQAPNPYWTFYFHVDDIDAAQGRIAANGGSVLFGPQEVPGGAWIINALDPQGAMFSIAGPKAG
ncbi:VOC family protein [Rhizorhabdus wittichii]|uniref:VOC family protein n=1 Tax=Rhizorhabdus wittichii TaxID=160791 RepID=A0A975HFN8_9SPHN|nr:VOC family protein [Rhizorhabdus wittichii]QTH23595.1 VOC family protein [Rhizorhabdus wittichii]